MNHQIEVVVSRTEVKSIEFGLQDIYTMISILNGVAVPMLGKDHVDSLLAKLNSLRLFAEGD